LVGSIDVHLGRTPRRDAIAHIRLRANVPDIAFDSPTRVAVLYYASSDTCQDGLHGPTDGRRSGKSRNDCLQVIVARDTGRFERQIERARKILDKGLEVRSLFLCRQRLEAARDPCGRWTGLD
jgi:hypothetical protein